MRAWNWNKAAGFISISTESLWHVCPEQCIIMESRNYQANLMQEDAVFYGFVDGAFQRKSFEECKAGIGGFLKTKNETLCYIFSGPVTTSSSMQTEWLALK